MFLICFWKKSPTIKLRSHTADFSPSCLFPVLRGSCSGTFKAFKAFSSSSLRTAALRSSKKSQNKMQLIPEPSPTKEIVKTLTEFKEQDGSRHSRCSAEKGGWRAVLAQALLWYLQDCSVVEKLCDGRYWLSEAFCLPDLFKLLSCMPFGFSYLSLDYFIFRRVVPKMCFPAEKLFQFLVAETLPVSRSISIMRICSHLQ